MEKDIAAVGPHRLGGRNNRRARLALAGVFSFTIAAVGLLLAKNDIVFMDTLDKRLGDLRTALLSPRAPSTRADIAILLITETTLLDYPSRSPIDRRLLAELVRAVDTADPKAIGLDIILDRHTEHDVQFLTAIRAARAPVVLGAVDKRLTLPQQSLRIQDELLAAAGRTAGHMLFERTAGKQAVGDMTVRLVAAPLDGTGRRQSFSAELARAAGKIHEPPNRTISWQLPPRDTRLPLYATFEVPKHKVSDIRPGLAGVLPDHWRSQLKGRIVLIGGSVDGQDQHPTPLSATDGGTMPGVVIHAQALAQRLDGHRDVQELTWWLELPLAAIVTFACFWAGRRYRLRKYGKVYQFVGLFVVGLVSLLFFGLAQISLSSAAFAFAWLSGALAGQYSAWLLRYLGKHNILGVRDHGG